MYSEVDNAVTFVKRKLEVSVDGKVVDCEEFEFESCAVQLLKDYCENAWRLCGSAIFNQKAANRFTISGTQQNSLSSEGDLIDDEAWDAGMLRFRPLVLQKKEPSNFYRAASIIAERIKNENVRNKLKTLRKQFRGELALMRLHWFDNGKKLSMDDIFDLWLNAFEYHRDQDKRDFFQRTEKLAPELKMRHHIYMHAVEKLRAIMGLFQLIVDLLGDDFKPVELRELEAKRRSQNV